MKHQHQHQHQCARARFSADLDQRITQIAMDRAQLRLYMQSEIVLHARDARHMHKKVGLHAMRVLLIQANIPTPTDVP
jgi:hypothetical protein